MLLYMQCNQHVVPSSVWVHTSLSKQIRRACSSGVSRIIQAWLIPGPDICTSDVFDTAQAPQA